MLIVIPVKLYRLLEVLFGKNRDISVWEIKKKIYKFCRLLLYMEENVINSKKLYKKLNYYESIIEKT